MGDMIFTVAFSKLRKAILIGDISHIAHSLWATFAIKLDIHHQIGLVRSVGVAINRSRNCGERWNSNAQSEKKRRHNHIATLLFSPIDILEALIFLKCLRYRGDRTRALSLLTVLELHAWNGLGQSLVSQGTWYYDTSHTSR